MQKKSSSDYAAQPSHTQLKAFADRLESLHSADFRDILWSIAQLRELYPATDLVVVHGGIEAFADPLHEAADLAQTLAVVSKELKESEFHAFVEDVIRVFDLSICYFLSECNDDRRSEADRVLAQLRRHRAFLGNRTSTQIATAGSPEDSNNHPLGSPLSIFAAICFAGLVWDLAADHFPLWHLLATIGLVAGFGGLVFRLGQKAAATENLSDVNTELNR